MMFILSIVQTLGLAALGVWACIAKHPVAGGWLIFGAIMSITTFSSDDNDKDKELK